MNLIVVCLDSFRQDHVSAYHRGRQALPDIQPCRTPNLDAFAADSLVFTNATPMSLPTIPIRTELMTGQCILPTRGWTPLAPAETPIGVHLHRAGYVSGLITDIWHYRAPGMNFHQGFNVTRWIRGQEYDGYTSHRTKRNLEDFVLPKYNEWWRELVNRFLTNTDEYARPDDWFPARVVGEAVEWLEKNRSQKKLFCWIDCFDPHEPWDPPKPFDTYTDPAYRGPRVVMPMGGRALDWATAEQIRHTQGLYAGEAAFVDHCLGPLFAALKRLGYYEDSAILVLADHGHPLADRGKFLKGGDRVHSELLKVPFMLRLPKGRRGTTDALIQFPDVLPTLFELLGIPGAGMPFHGSSFAKVVRGESPAHRNATISGYHEAEDRCVRDGTWSYIRRPEGQPDELYNLQEDPGERTNLIDRHPAEATRLAASFAPALFRKPATVVKGVQGKYEVASGTL